MNYMSLESEPLGFHGSGEYAIRLIRDTWTWYNTVTNTTMAQFRPEKRHHNYPLGRNKWMLKVNENDSVN